MQETDPGKFTLAFSSWMNGICWAVHLERELMRQEWPEDLLELEEFAIVRSADGTMTQCGLQAQVCPAHSTVAL